MPFLTNRKKWCVFVQRVLCVNKPMIDKGLLDQYVLELVTNVQKSLHTGLGILEALEGLRMRLV